MLFMIYSTMFFIAEKKLRNTHWGNQFEIKILLRQHSNVMCLYTDDKDKCWNNTLSSYKI